MLGLQAALGARTFPARGSGLTGLDLAVSPRVHDRLRLALGLDLMYGRQLVRDWGGPIGELDTLWLSLGAAVYFPTRTVPEFQLGPMVRLAYVRVLTSTDREDFTASDQDGWLMMFGVSSVLRFELSPRWGLFIGADIAYVPGGLNFRADETRAISFADLMLSFRLGLSWSS